VDVTVVLVGPTAAGKSSLAANLVRRYGAERQQAEIVNADSMLVYRGMDIGTAKPSAAERVEIRHHMVDLLDVNQSWAFAVNDAGQIIGRRDLATGREARLWHRGVDVTLPDLDADSSSATGISPRGILMSSIFMSELMPSERAKLGCR